MSHSFFLINCKFWILSQILRFWQHWASVLAYQQLAVAVWHLELVCQLPGPAGFWGFTLTKGIYVGRRVWGVKNSRTFGKSFSGKIHLFESKQMGVLWDLLGDLNGQVFALPGRWYQSLLRSLSGYKDLNNNLQIEFLRTVSFIIESPV